jgi:hypothetical protein
VCIERIEVIVASISRLGDVRGVVDGLVVCIFGEAIGRWCWVLLVVPLQLENERWKSRIINSENTKSCQKNSLTSNHVVYKLLKATCSFPEAVNHSKNSKN